MSEEKSEFEVLSAIDVSSKVDKKGKLSYLSWAWAWAELKKHYPNSVSTVYETIEGRIYWDDGRTAWVKCGVTVNDLEHIEYLPIMDFKNASIPSNKVTSFDANKAIQRAITKAISRHGLGLYIYAGEDLPESPPSTLDQVRVAYSVAEKKDAASLADFLESKGLTPADIGKLDEKGLQDLLKDINEVFA